MTALQTGFRPPELRGVEMNRVAGIGGTIQTRSRLMPEGANIAISSGGVEAVWIQFWVTEWGTPQKRLATHVRVERTGAYDHPIGRVTSVCA